MSSIISYRHVFLTFAILVHLLQASARTVTNVTVDGFEHLTVVNAAKSKFGRFLLGSQPQSALTVPFRIAINTGREAAFEQHVLDISTPGNPKYGQFMSYEDIKNFLRPSPNVTQSLIEWLMRHGIPRSRIQDEGDWLNFDAPITDASKLLNTTFNYFTHESTGIELLRTTQYFVPTRLRQYIKLIVPTTQFQDVVDQRFETARFNAVNIPTGLYPGQQLNVTFCNKTITPQCVLDLYQVQDAAKIASNSRIGVTGFYGTANTTNVQSFYKNFAPYAQNETILVLTEEAQTKQVNTEAELDTEYASSIAYPIPTTFYAGGYDPTVVPFVNLLNYILSLPDGQLPQVITNSYGLAEQYLDQSYALKTCGLISQLAARGVSFIAASGDSGPGKTCKDVNTKIVAFEPVFPATCPWVTSVGGTVYVRPESASSASSGGFSNYFARPQYQNTAVAKYLSTQAKPEFKSYYNASGRAFPDISAQSDNIVAFESGSTVITGGTSAAAPIVAGIFALLINNRLNQGNSPFGFLNPLLYSNPSWVTDITLGRSDGCHVNGNGTGPYNIQNAGFDAVPGWDPVTGLGTPYWPGLQELITKKVGNSIDIPGD